MLSAWPGTWSLLFTDSQLPSRSISLKTNEITEHWHNHMAKLIGGYSPVGRVLAPSGQGWARGSGLGRDGVNWDCCPNNSSGNASTHPPCPKVKGITIGSLFRVQKPHSPILPQPVCRMHNTPPLPHHQPPSFLELGNHPPKDL